MLPSGRKSSFQIALQSPFHKYVIMIVVGHRYVTLYRPETVADGTVGFEQKQLLKKYLLQ